MYGYYYYSSELPGVLQQVRTHWESLGLPMGYLQLDSWWYPKGPDASWTDSSDGIYLYEADTTLFPNGLGAFQTSVGVPAGHPRAVDRLLKPVPSRSTPCPGMWSSTRRTGTTA